MTSERRCAASVPSTYDEHLSLVCTLFSSGTGFVEKLCTFAAVEQGASETLAGLRTIGKCKVDISPYASAAGVPTAASSLELSLTKNSQRVGTLRFSICSRRLRDVESSERHPSSARRSSTGDGCDAGTKACTDPRSSHQVTINSIDPSRVSEISDFDDDDFSESSSQCSDTLASAQQVALRLAELDDFPLPSDAVAGEAIAASPASTDIVYRGNEVLDGASYASSHSCRPASASDRSLVSAMLVMPVAPPIHSHTVHETSPVGEAARAGNTLQGSIVRQLQADDEDRLRTLSGTGYTINATPAPASAPSPVPVGEEPIPSDAQTHRTAESRSQRHLRSPTDVPSPPSGGRKRAATVCTASGIPGDLDRGDVVSIPLNSVQSFGRRSSGTTGGESSRGCGTTPPAMARVHTVAHAYDHASQITSGLEAGERSRVEAERRQLEAQASASLAMQRKVRSPFHPHATASIWLITEAHMCARVGERLLPGGRAP